jgi:hypothetical protein
MTLRDNAGNAIGNHNPLAGKMYIEGRTANTTAVSNGSNVPAAATTVGVQVVKQFSIPELDWSYVALAGGIIDTADKVAKAAAGSGIRNYVANIQLINAGTVATEFVIKDGVTIIWRTFLPANMTAPVDITFFNPLKSTANAAINIACITTGAAVYANVQGYAAP